jgi:hypothetical protein
MNFVFEKHDYNLITCPDRNRSGVSRVTASPMIGALLRLSDTNAPITNMDLKNIAVGNDPESFEKYIIPLGVTHSPREWVGVDSKNTGGIEQIFPERHTLFAFIKPKYLQDMQQGRAFMLLDQCHEGYHEPWLFDWFHTNCEDFGINPRQIIYVTGDLDVTKKYEAWCQARNIRDRMCAIGHPHFEMNVYTTGINKVRIDQQPPMMTVEEQIQYKTDNLRKIKLYNALQKRPRAHRAWLFYELVRNNLLKDGINSMNYVEQINCYFHGRFMQDDEYKIFGHLLPMLPPSEEQKSDALQAFANIDSGKYQQKFNEDICHKTWFSIISEASFADSQCFISEKTFKPLFVGHPFIVYGNRNSLSYLREMGYQTFHPWIDETYDTLDVWDRLNAIIDAVNKIKALTNKERLKWFVGMQDILLHNQEVLRRNATETLPDSYIKLKNHFDHG